MENRISELDGSAPQIVRFEIKPSPSEPQVVVLDLPYGFDKGLGFQDGKRYIMRGDGRHFELMPEDE